MKNIKNKVRQQIVGFVGCGRKKGLVDPSCKIRQEKNKREKNTSCFEPHLNIGWQDSGENGGRDRGPSGR